MAEAGGHGLRVITASEPVLANDEQCAYADGQLVAWPTADPPGYVLSGVMDRRNVSSFDRWLRSALIDRRQRRDPGDTHIQLRALEFGDTSGIRALIEAAREIDGAGRLILHGFPRRLGTRVKAVVWNSSLLIADRRSTDAGCDWKLVLAERRVSTGVSRQPAS